jgi:5-methylcytosine-specific restriction endonuclease McrA
MSDKKRKQLGLEKELTRKLIIRQKGLCAECGKLLGWGSAKHEIKFRSQGGDPTDENNTQLLCITCHGEKHGLKIVEDKNA